MTDAEKMSISGRYRLIKVIGTGGMGRVWLGQDELIGREVAIKELLLPPGLDDTQHRQLSGRAIREARAAGRLAHPGIVTVHDVVEHRGAPAIVMEYVRGGSLAEAIRAQGRLPVEQVAAIGTAMLAALRVAHEAGIVHRDLKPANVLLAGDRVVITDFGIASLTGDAQLTRSGMILGTPAYMAPEQAHRRPTTPASDLWSLGATLYAAVEGRPPYAGDDFVAVLSALLTRDPPPPQHAGRLAPVLNSLLRKDPAQRPTAEQAARLLAVPSFAPTVHPPISASIPPTIPPAIPPTIPPAGSPSGARVVRRRAMLFGGAVAAVGVGVPTALWLLDRDDPGGGRSPGAAGASPRSSGSAQESGDTKPGRPAEITDHIQLRHGEPVTSVAFSPDGKLLASGDGALNEGAKAQLWNVIGGRHLATLTGPPSLGGASANIVVFSPDGTILACGGNAGLGDSIRLWNVARRRAIGTLDQSRSIISSLAFSPDGKILAGTRTNGPTTLWDVSTRRVRIGLQPSDGFRNLMFSPDGKLLVEGGKGREIRLCDPATGRTIHTLTDATGSGVSFSPDGKTLAAPDSDGTYSLRLWDVATGRSKVAFDRSDELVTSVLFSPDGRTLAAWSSSGNLVQLWDVASRQVRAVLIGHSGPILTVAFSPDGTRIASAGRDRTIRIWRPST